MPRSEGKSYLDKSRATVATGDEAGTEVELDDGDGWWDVGSAAAREVSVDDDESESEMRRLERRAGGTGTEGESRCRGRFCPRWRRRRPRTLIAPLVGDLPAAIFRNVSSAVGFLIGSGDNDDRRDFAFLLMDFFFLGGILRV